MKNKLLIGLAVFLALAAGLTLMSRSNTKQAEGFNSILTAFEAKYTNVTGSRIGNCGTCHADFTSGGLPFNQYGQAIEDQIVNNGLTAAQAIVAVEGMDSDGDGTTNVAEINLLFEPGWNCSNYTTAVNAPANLNTFVAPAVPGCSPATSSPTPTPVVTNSPTPTPVVTNSPAPTPTPTPTTTPTLKPSPTPTPTPSPTLKPSPTVTPASLPRTGGPGDGGGLSTTTLLLMLAFASAVILTAGVSVLTARDKRNR